MKFRSASKHSKGYECSSKGDKRFSALTATLRDGRTIEEAFQLDIKGYRQEAEDKFFIGEIKSWQKWMTGKGKIPKSFITHEEIWHSYKDLWKQWAIYNFSLLEELREKATFGILTDMFASTDISQARALAEILNETSPDIEVKNEAIEKENRYLRHMESVEKTKEENKKNGIRGDVRIARLPYRLSEEYNDWPLQPGYKNIAVCTNSVSRFGQFSMMRLGPISHEEPDLPPAENMENLWQYTKVFKGDVNKDGTIKDEYFARREEGFRNKKAHRRVKPDKDFLFSWWKGKRLNHAEAQKEIYIKTYSNIIVEHDSFKELQRILDEGWNIQIVGYDGYDYCAKDDPDGDILASCLNDSTRPFGHEFVLAGLLSDKKVWLEESKFGHERDIERTRKLWNPMTGCSKYSDGCKNCYAEYVAIKKQKDGSPKYANGFKYAEHKHLLNVPLKTRKPTEFFVNSMSDVFHEDASDDFILEIFEVMNKASHHIFMLLTKRPERVLKLKDKIKWTDNIWMGVTVESDKYLFRVDLLHKTGAKFKHLSLEPLLSSLQGIDLTDIHWVVVGGESGYNKEKRIMKAEWVREIRDLCKKMEVPLFFKQWGSLKNNPNKTDHTIGRPARAGNLLDGRVWEQVPKALVSNRNKKDYSTYVK